jgi:LPXTG-site transpeptidase (sortase) family protein
MTKAKSHSPLEKIMRHKWRFLSVFLLLFFFSYVTLQAAGLVPRSLIVWRSPASVVTPTETPNELIEVEGEFPLRIEVPAVGVAATVSNPNTTNIDALDRALLAGAVRYPGTAKLGEEGNVLIFGHSSYLPVIYNQSYKAFNDIQHLKQDDQIIVYGDNKKFIYAVERVEESNTSTGEIRLDVDGAKLTLATCDTFGAKSDRFIVTAHLVSVSEI